MVRQNRFREIKRDGDCKGGDGGAAEAVAVAEAAVSTASIFA